MRHIWMSVVVVALAGTLGLTGLASAGERESRPRPLSSNTIGAEPTPRAISVPGNYALSIDTDLSLSYQSVIFKSGSPFLHTQNGNLALGSDALINTTQGYYGYIGSGNTAVGGAALTENTSGFDNTAVGLLALRSNTTGHNNTAIGAFALRRQIVGDRSTAVGDGALANVYGGTFFNNGQPMAHNTAVGAFALMGGAWPLTDNTGYYNTAIGESALKQNTSGSRNTAVGRRSLLSNSSGFINIALGHEAGSVITTGNRNILIGHSGGSASENRTIRIGNPTHHAKVYISGIEPQSAVSPICLNEATEQLGLCGSSSRQIKQDIGSIGDAATRLMELRPVQFRFREEFDASDKRLHFGLIAEEVAQVIPELVGFDDEGRPVRVKYELLSTLLLNELQKQAARIEDLERRLEE